MLSFHGIFYSFMRTSAGGGMHGEGSTSTPVYLFLHLLVHSRKHTHARTKTDKLFPLPIFFIYPLIVVVQGGPQFRYFRCENFGARDNFF